MEKFIEKFIEEMAIEANVDLKTELDSLDEWDSMGHVVTANFLNEEYSLSVTPEEMSNFKTLEEIVIHYNILK